MRNNNFMEKAASIAFLLILSVAVFIGLGQSIDFMLPEVSPYVRNSICSMISFLIGFFGLVAIKRIKLWIKGSS